MNRLEPDFLEFLNSLPIKGGARTRISNCLYAEGITSFDKLVSHTYDDLLRLPYMGRGFLQVLIGALTSRGLHLASVSAQRLWRCPTCGQIVQPAGALQDAADE